MTWLVPMDALGLLALCDTSIFTHSLLQPLKDSNAGRRPRGVEEVNESWKELLIFCVNRT